MREKVLLRSVSRKDAKVRQGAVSDINGEPAIIEATRLDAVLRIER